MSLYNMLFGYNILTPVLLKALNLDPAKIGRFRDIWVDKEKQKIIVFTRLGGGNRDYYQENIEYLRKNPLYITDYDDDFDFTYAYFEFKIPEKWKAVIDDLYEIQGEPIPFKVKFENIIKEIQEKPLEELKKDKRFSGLLEVLEKVIKND